MRIGKIRVKNIRSYKDLELDLSPNLNVLYGKTDSGKSALVKCLLFAIDNYSTKKTIRNGAVGEALVSLSDGNSEVIRRRDKGVNGYSVIVNGEKRKDYNAIAKDIPPEVSKVLNLSSSNIQQQKETYFLIDKSDGVISKKLNEVSGLSEIDTSIKNITTEINNISSDIRGINNNIASDKAKIEETKWTKQAHIELLAIEKLEKEIEELDSSIFKTDALLSLYKNTKSQLDNLLPSSIIQDFKEISTLQNIIYSEESEIDSLWTVIDKYEKTKRSLDNCIIIDLSEVEKINEEVEQLEYSIKNIADQIDYYNTAKNSLLAVEAKLNITEKSIKEVPFCQTCNRPL